MNLVPPLLLLTLAVLPVAQTAPAGGANTAWAVWGLVMLGVAVALLAIELFVPSGGIVGIAAVVALVAGIVMLFWSSTVLGLLGMLGAFAAIPVLGTIALRVWPQTPVAQWIMLKDVEPEPDATERGPATRAAGEDGSVRPASPGSDLVVGLTGRAVTDLRPVGEVRFDPGFEAECLAQAGLIEAGTRVRIVSIDGMSVRVREVNDAPA